MDDFIGMVIVVLIVLFFWLTPAEKSQVLNALGSIWNAYHTHFFVGS